MRGGHPLQRQGGLSGGGGAAKARRLPVGRIAARIAEQQRIFADGGQVHVFMRHLPAHHACIRLHSYHGQLAAAEDVEIGLVMRLILGIQALPGGVQAVTVQHGELAHADQPGARAGVITPFGLQLIDQRRKLPVRADFAFGERGHHFFMRHCQGHGAVVAVSKAAHLCTDGIPAAGLLPQFGGVNHRHRNLLPADGVHLSADDAHNVHQGALGQRQIAENARCQRPDEPGAQQQLMTDHFGLGGGLSQCGSKQAGKFHGI